MTLIETLMNRDGLTREDATAMVLDARERVLDFGEDPEEILLDEFNLEPDYVFDLIGA